MALTFTNTTDTTYSSALVAADSPITKLSGGGNVSFNGTSNTFSGSVQHTAGGLMIWFPTSNNQNIFSTSSTTTYNLNAGTISIIKNATIAPAFTVNANLTGAGAIGLQGDNGNASTMTVAGSLVGLNQIQSYSPTFAWSTGFRVYASGGVIVRDLSRQFTYSSIAASTLTARVDIASGAAQTAFDSTLIFDAEGAGAFNAVLQSSSLAGAPAFSFGNATTGSLVRTSKNSASAVTFVLGGVNTGSNTVSYGTTVVGGSLLLKKQDAGTWVLAGNNSALTSTTVEGGTLRATNANAFGGAVTLSNAGVVLELANNITVSTATAINAIGTIRNVSGSNSLTGAIVLAAATTIESQAGTLTLNSGTSITGATQPLTFSGAGNHTVTSVIATTTGTVTKNGAGTTTLNGANSFSGSITHNAGVIEANTITASGNNSLGTGTSYTFGGAGTLRYTGSTPAELSKTVVSVPASGAVFENNGTSAWTVSSLTAASAGTVLGLAGSNAGYNRLSPALLPSNLVGFTKTGAGRWISTLNVNPASGSTAVNGGTLVASNSNGTSKLFGYDVTVASGAKIQTGSDEVGQLGKCAYNNLTFNGVVGTPARIRIGGSAINPTIYMNGNLALPVSGTVTFNVTADVFKTPGTYTLVEFAGAFGVTGGNVASNAVAVAPTGRTGTLAYVAGTPNRITVTIA